MKLLLTRNFIDALTRPYDAEVVKFMLHPNISDSTEPFVIVNDDNKVEIICFKRTVIKIFLECHDYCNSLELLRPDDQYLFTMGLLLSTTENRSALNLHKKLVSNLDASCLDRELRFLERLLSSNYPKLNKSSSLWEFYKQMYAKFKNALGFNVWQTFTLSCEQHFANYYCCNFIRWYSTQLSDSERGLLVRNLFSFAKQHVSDPSIWGALGFMIDKNTVENAIGFIDALPVTNWCPFITILEYSSRDKSTADKLRLRWKKSSIEFDRGSPVIPEDVANDLNALSTFMNDAFKTLLLQKLESL